MNPQIRVHIHPSNLLRACGLALFVSLTVLLAHRATAQTQSNTTYLPFATSNRNFDVEPVGQGFYVVTSITHAGDERIFVTERGGRIQILHPDNRETTFLDLSAKVVSSPGEYGLFDIAFHPGYADPSSPGFGLFYVFYNGREGDAIYSYISRFRVSADADVADPTSEVWLLRLQQLQLWHKGGELEFDPRDNSLYAAVGDDANPPNAQLLNSPKGKIIRLPVDDVPAAAAGDASDQIQPEYVVMGLRNPYRFDLDPQTNRLFIGDVGESTWEEISVATLDGSLPNMGWPCREGPEPFTLFQNHPVCAGSKTFVEPAASLAHIDGHCAVVAGRFTRRGNSAGEFIYSDLCSKEVFSMNFVDGAWNSTRLGNAGVGGMVTTIGEDANGNLYIGNTESNGPIYRLILR